MRQSTTQNPPLTSLHRDFKISFLNKLKPKHLRIKFPIQKFWVWHISPRLVLFFLSFRSMLFTHCGWSLESLGVRISFQKLFYLHAQRGSFGNFNFYSWLTQGSVCMYFAEYSPEMSPILSQNTHIERSTALE